MPFTDTAACKTLALTLVTAASAGIATTGGAAATHALGAHHTPPGVYIGVTLADHADPNHVDPAGEVVHIEDAPTIGTAAVNHVVVGPSD